MRDARAIAVGLAILLSSQYCILLVDHEQEALRDDDESQFTSRNTGIVDLPTWRINDRWTYDGELDVRDFIATSGVSTTVDFLEGSLVKNIDDIYVTTVDNRSTLVYEAHSDGTYEAEDIELDGNDGDLVVEIDTTEIVRASDLAIVSQEATIDIDFEYQILWWTVNIDVADLVISQTFSPPTEGYDFPLSVGDEWSTDYYQDTSTQVRATTWIFPLTSPHTSPLGGRSSVGVLRASVMLLVSNRSTSQTTTRTEIRLDIGGFARP